MTVYIIPLYLIYGMYDTMISYTTGIHIEGAQSSCCAAYDQGSGPIHMDDVRCTGSELSLINCPHNTHPDCHHIEDASVLCQTSAE